MDLSQLEVFLTVARERRFSRAAEKLFRTQSAVSQTIRKLELEIGEPLFDRSSRDGTLTDAGRVLREYAQELENLRDRLEVLAAGLSRMPPADPDRVSIAEELHAAITCVLQDALRPAIDDLHAAAKYTSEPKEGDPVP